MLLLFDFAIAKVVNVQYMTVVERMLGAGGMTLLYEKIAKREIQYHDCSQFTSSSVLTMPCVEAITRVTLASR
jgi:hypothetical protein